MHHLICFTAGRTFVRYFGAYAAFSGCIDTRPRPEQEAWFSGRIVYSYSYSSSELDADSLALERWSSGQMIFHGPDYMSRYVGLDTSTYFYSGPTGRCAAYEPGKQPYCEDYRAPTDSIASISIKPASELVLGRTCDLVELKGRWSDTRYWVSRELRMDPASYALHHAYNWKAYADASKGGIILKVEHRFSRYTMHGTATLIEPIAPSSEFVELRARSEALCEARRP